MLTTLYCDASFCPDKLVGGWAIWLRSGEGRHVESGPSPRYCVSSNEVEFVAIYAGIYRAVTRWPSTTAILVRSDSTTALGWMEGSHEARGRMGRRLQQLIAGITTKHNVCLIPRWVKGHRSGRGTDVWLNNRVDQMAREEMQRERRRTRE
jgi:ribonuclease HI